MSLEGLNGPNSLHRIEFVVSLDTICIKCGMFSVDKVAKLLFDAPLLKPSPLYAYVHMWEGIVGTLRG